MAANSWDQKIRDIINETDTNISILKKNMIPKYLSPRNPYSQSLGRPEEGSKFFNYSSISETPAQTMYASESIFNEGSILRPDQSQHRNSFGFLSKKISDMEQNLLSMSKTAAKLQYENKVQNEEIKQLKGELKHVSRRLHEKGVDMSTEHKLKAWQQEVRSEIGMINKLMKSKSTTAEHVELFDTSLITLSRDIAENKRLSQDGADSNRREIDHMRTRILRLENDVATSIGEIKELAMHHVELKRDVASVSNRRKTHYSEISLGVENETLKAEIAELRQKIDGFLKEFSKKPSTQIDDERLRMIMDEIKNEVISTQNQNKTLSAKNIEKSTELNDNDEYDILSTELDDDSSLNLSDDDYTKSSLGDNEFLRTLEDDEISWSGRKKFETSIKYDDIF